MKYIYYPGCSLSGTGRAYEESILPVFKALDIQFEELDEWNCCGATAYMAVDEEKAFALAARNLALAEEQGSGDSDTPPTIVAPCAACYLVLSKAKHYMTEYPELNKKVTNALKAADLDYKGEVVVRHPLDILVNDIGLDRIKAAVKKPLDRMKVAPYYGCQIVRPYAEFDDQDNPVTMDRILQALGAEVVDYPLKARCCGGSLTGTMNKVGVRLNYILIKEAKRRGANVMATACPLCQFNLECYQGKMSAWYGEPIRMPVTYFSQLMGLAFGISEKELGFNHIFVKPEPALV